MWQQKVLTTNNNATKYTHCTINIDVYTPLNPFLMS